MNSSLLPFTCSIPGAAEHMQRNSPNTGDFVQLEMGEDCGQDLGWSQDIPLLGLAEESCSRHARNGLMSHLQQVAQRYLCLLTQQWPLLYNIGPILWVIGAILPFSHLLLCNATEIASLSEKVGRRRDGSIFPCTLYSLFHVGKKRLA